MTPEETAGHMYDYMTAHPDSGSRDEAITHIAHMLRFLSEYLKNPNDN